MASELDNVQHSDVPVHEHNLPSTAHEPFTQNTSQYVLLLEIIGISQYPWLVNCHHKLKKLSRCALGEHSMKSDL